MQTLAERVQDLLKNRPTSRRIEDIAREANVSTAFLYGLINRGASQTDRVQRVFELLSDTPLFSDKALTNELPSHPGYN